jgi:F0F1-type ATP synthase assembly protein I
MNWNDYEAAWKRQPLPVGPAADLTGLRDTFETKRRKLAATLQIRDYMESGAGLLVSAIFAWIWSRLGREAWPIGLAILLMLGVSAFFLRERRRAHRLRLGPEASLLAKIDADLAELRHQRHLLLNVGTWYLLPCAGAIVLFGIAVFLKMRRELPPERFSELSDHAWLIGGFAGFMVVFMGLLFWAVWAMNRQAVRKNIEPRIAELEKLRGDLTNVEGAAPAGPQVRA